MNMDFVYDYLHNHQNVLNEIWHGTEDVQVAYKQLVDSAACHNIKGELDEYVCCSACWLLLLYVCICVCVCMVCVMCGVCGL